VFVVNAFSYGCRVPDGHYWWQEEEFEIEGRPGTITIREADVDNQGSATLIFLAGNGLTGTVFDLPGPGPHPWLDPSQWIAPMPSAGQLPGNNLVVLSPDPSLLATVSGVQPALLASTVTATPMAIEGPVGVNDLDGNPISGGLSAYEISVLVTGYLLNGEETAGIPFHWLCVMPCGLTYPIFE
jgi:hypothetical protein